MIIERTEAFVQTILAQAEKGHDWQHVNRVRINALQISRHEDANPLIVELGALLHDIADRKFHNNDDELGPALAEGYLASLGVETTVIDQVVYIIENVSYAGGRIIEKPTIELQIVQDADKMDAMGAIGIARCFHYGGYKNREIYNSEIAPSLHMTEEEYKLHEGPSFNHLLEKIVKLPELMHTETGRKMAWERHEFLLSFIEQFKSEV